MRQLNLEVCLCGRVLGWWEAGRFVPKDRRMVFGESPERLVMGCGGEGCDRSEVVELGAVAPSATPRRP